MVAKETRSPLSDASAAMPTHVLSSQQHGMRLLDGRCDRADPLASGGAKPTKKSWCSAADPRPSTTSVLGPELSRHGMTAKQKERTSSRCRATVAGLGEHHDREQGTRRLEPSCAVHEGKRPTEQPAEERQVSGQETCRPDGEGSGLGRGRQAMDIVTSVPASCTRARSPRNGIKRVAGRRAIELEYEEIGPGHACRCTCHRRWSRLAAALGADRSAQASGRSTSGATTRTLGRAAVRSPQQVQRGAAARRCGVLRALSTACPPCGSARRGRPRRHQGDGGLVPEVMTTASSRSEPIAHAASEVHDVVAGGGAQLISMAMMRQSPRSTMRSISRSPARSADSHRGSAAWATRAPTG